MNSPKYLTGRLSADPTALAKIFRAIHAEGYHLHGHSYFELSFAIRGQAHHVINGEIKPFCAGYISFATPAVLHEYIPISGAEPLELIVLSFSMESVRPEFWQQIDVDKLPYYIKLGDAEFAAIHHAFMFLLSQAEKEKLPINLFTQTAIEWLLLCVAHRASALHEPASETGDTIQKIQPALFYMHNNFPEPITLEEVARVVCYSKDHFSHLFRSTTGKSFQEYLATLRLDYAANLLALTDFSISTVGELSGFRSLPYFIRTFKKRYGLTPTPFRDIRKKEQKALGLKT